MKKKFKGFTLIELIIVMAILSILMTAILQMFKPIRDTYVDSTFYENQRTAQNGMITYISESVRYCTDLGLYAGGSYGSAQSAVDAFAAAYVAKYYASAPDKSAKETAVKENAQVIVVNHKDDFKFGGDWTGRLQRRNKFGSSTVSDSTDFRLAMGAPYYGENNYTITLSNSTGKAEDGIEITVASYLNRGSNSKLVTVKGEVVCKNLMKAKDHGIDNVGIFDVASSHFSPSGTINTYIVYLDEKI